MKKFVQIGILLIAFVGMSTVMQAQKFGYMNSQAILAEMAEVKQMQANLQALSTQLQKKGQGMVEAYRKQEEEAVGKKERGELSPLDEENLLKDLQVKQEEILAFEKDMQSQLAKKEQTLLEPILERINKAIEAVAAENGFQMIFDASAGILLYADETSDVSNLVKSKLGI
ncbi:MAG: OmpH family outer membrane protein [Bacteroidota bacterium]